jgi:hypothetical protein
MWTNACSSLKNNDFKNKNVIFNNTKITRTLTKLRFAVGATVTEHGATAF